jgi:hypothetical protein
MRFTTTSVAIFTLIAFGGFPATILAQGVSEDNNGNPSILQVVEDLQTALTTLQTSVGTLQTSLNALIASTSQDNSRITPAAVATSPDVGICTATNVTDTPRTIHVQMIDGNNGALLSENGGSGQLVQPGRSAVAPSTTNRRLFCVFTVVDGSRTDIRGGLAIYTAPSGSDKLALPAE